MNIFKIVVFNSIVVSMIGFLTLDTSSSLVSRIMCFFFVSIIVILINSLYTNWDNKSRIIAFGLLPFIYGTIGFFHPDGILSFIKSWQVPMIILYLVLLVLKIKIVLYEPLDLIYHQTSNSCKN